MPSPVEVEVAPEALAGLEVLVREHLAAVEARESSHVSGSHSRSFMPMSRSSSTKMGVCRPVGEVEGDGRHLEAFPRVLGEEEHVLGVAMGRIRAPTARRTAGCAWHPGRGAGALHVEDHRGNLGEVR
jgi:hypothetical protein